MILSKNKKIICFFNNNCSMKTKEAKQKVKQKVKQKAKQKVFNKEYNIKN